MGEEYFGHGWDDQAFTTDVPCSNAKVVKPRLLIMSLPAAISAKDSTLEPSQPSQSVAKVYASNDHLLLRHVDSLSP
jgi:hypothetical protein